MVSVWSVNMQQVPTLLLCFVSSSARESPGPHCACDSTLQSKTCCAHVVISLMEHSCNQWQALLDAMSWLWSVQAAGMMGYIVSKSSYGLRTLRQSWSWMSLHLGKSSWHRVLRPDLSIDGRRDCQKQVTVDRPFNSAQAVLMDDNLSVSRFSDLLTCVWWHRALYFICTTSFPTHQCCQALCGR